MKKIVGLAFAAAVVVGCSKGGSSANQPVAETNQSGTPQVSQSDPSATNNPAQNSPNPGAPPATTGSKPPQLQVQSRPIQTPPRTTPPPAQPAENPAAAPPRPGENVANNYRFEVGPKTVEVEGVCKLTEDEAVCWKPNGEKYEALATELTNAIKSKADSYSNTFQFKFMKKNRILVVKTTSKPMQPGNNGYTSYSMGIMNTSYGGPDMQEGWTNGNSAFSGSNGSSFDQTQTDRQVLTGAFNKGTKTFPLRYQFTSGTNERKVIPFAKGQFTIEGNSYEIVSINDKPENGQPNNGMYMGGMPAGSKPPKYTYVKIQVVKISNPYTVLNLFPADDSGAAYGGLNDKGEPITAEEQRKQRDEEMKKMMDAQRAGKPYMGSSANRMNGMNYIQSISLDPSTTFGRSGTQGFSNFAINVEASKIKKLSVTISKRTVYVFDKIKLDAN